MTKTLISMGLWGLIAWLIGEWIGPGTGWALLTLGLASMILVSGVQLHRIGRWAKDINAAPPPSVGPWDDVLAVIYRGQRKHRDKIAKLENMVSGIMLAAEALPDGAITLNEEMQITWCNKTASEHIGINLEKDRNFSIFNILRAPEFARYGRQSSWPEPILLHLAIDGQERSLRLRLTPYGIGQFLIVTHDVTQIEKLETTRRDFVANVSHELRTPLTVLSGFLETLRDLPNEAFAPGQREHYHALMLEQAQRMQAIVADLLTLSSLESTPIAAGEPVRLADTIETSLIQAKALSGGEHVFVENIDKDLCILGVETELASAVGNLLTNAVRYTPKSGTITVSWYRTETGNACYSVQDTGIGVASQDLPRLTERFYRADRGRSRTTGGTGLGLAITKHVALRHNAELHIRSRVGVGSLFSIEFPATRVADNAAHVA
ncbi:MAG: phosphate regulon sensor histidine kinase PhoR [Burkholderiaceae bacterium]|nr:MAG: phosphate regulon sensor histidine kinase PhoR [Burkholderiaceae bacterium]